MDNVNDSLNDCTCPKIPGGIIEVNWEGRIPICCKCKGAVVPPKPELRQGEIPVVDRLENFKQSCLQVGATTEAMAVGDCIEIVERYWQAYVPTREPEPVSVSLENCAKIVDETMQNGGVWDEAVMKTAKAVLDAAQVKYVD